VLLLLLLPHVVLQLILTPVASTCSGGGFVHRWDRRAQQPAFRGFLNLFLQHRTENHAAKGSFLKASLHSAQVH
jgi:hypothetical protein